MFNAVFKIPMQFFILLLGVLVFVFYQFERPPVFFNQAAWHRAVEQGSGEKLRALESRFNTAHAEKQERVQAWLAARRAGNAVDIERERAGAVAAQERAEAARTETKAVLKAADPKALTNDSDYVFVTFILSYLPHGLVGLLIAVFFAATFSSKAGELNALASATTVDVYRHVIKRDANDAHYVMASKWFTALWGFVAIGFALFAHLAENLIQATNIIGSIFYGVVLGMFLVAFFMKWIHGTAVFWAALIAQALVFVLYAITNISYLWFNVIGCVACVLVAQTIQAFLPRADAGGADGSRQKGR
jgi:SSS family solute:Na+ symporter